MVEEQRHRAPEGAAAVACVITLAGVALALNQLLNLQFLAGVVLIDNRYLYLLGGLFLSLVFLAYPAGRAAPTARVPLYDVLLCAATLALSGYLALESTRILSEGWEFAAPPAAVAASAAYWGLVLEATRRAGGLPIACIALVVSLYPVFADRVPGPISGLPQSLPDTLAYHILSGESAFGIPMRAFGELVVGFIVFGVALNYTGGGKFFNDMAFALVGRFRGGAAQVGVLSSALQGSISGSVISNVISSGVVTIPAMRRTGFSARYAAAVEAVASTGGVLMPPVMGSTAFVMATFLSVPYREVALAAAIPALLFYFGLAVQIDAYAARRGLGALPAAELPRMGAALREGWPYVAVFALLVGVMLLGSQEALAPFYATGLLLAINQLHPRHRMGWRTLGEFVQACGRALAELVAVLAGVGLIVGAFSVTGLAGTLVNDLVFLAGDSPLLLLGMGAVTSFVFGMGMTVTACYIFLAITLAPAVIRAGLDPLAVHLFVLYWGMVSFITPPVALGAFAAASIARVSPFAVGLESMRLGSVLYVVPFFFVLNPSLILHAPWPEVVADTLTAALGVALTAGALQGYLVGAGAMNGSVASAVGRLLVFAGGLTFAVPGGGVLGLDRPAMAALAVALAVPGAALVRVAARRPGGAPRPAI